MYIYTQVIIWTIGRRDSKRKLLFHLASVPPPPSLTWTSGRSTPGEQLAGSGCLVRVPEGTLGGGCGCLLLLLLATSTPHQPAGVSATLSLKSVVVLSHLHPTDTQHVPDAAALRQPLFLTVEEDERDGNVLAGVVHYLGGARVVPPLALVGGLEQGHYAHDVHRATPRLYIAELFVGVRFSAPRYARNCLCHDGVGLRQREVLDRSRVTQSLDRWLTCCKGSPCNQWKAE